jgi:hypothetical protein
MTIIKNRQRQRQRQRQQQIPFGYDNKKGKDNSKDQMRALVGDLPAYGALGEGDGGGVVACDGVGHGGEGSLNILALSPDGDFFHGVGVGDSSLFESVVDGDGSRAGDAGDFAVAVAEAWGVTGSGGCYGVATDVDAGLHGLLEELIFHESVQLLGLCGVAGLEGKPSVGEEAVGAFEIVVVDAEGEVGWCGGGFAGVVAACKDQGDEG